MKQAKTIKTVNVCSFCQQEGYLQICDICGKSFCISDQGIVPGCWGYTSICRDCANRKDVIKICERYAAELNNIYLNRNAELKRLGKRLIKRNNP